MFAYCNNNPVNMKDTNGRVPTFNTMMADGGEGRSNQGEYAQYVLQKNAATALDMVVDEPTDYNSIEAKGGQYSGTIGGAVSHTRLTVGKKNLIIENDMLHASATGGIGIKGVSLSGGVYLASTALSIRLFKNVYARVELNIGIGGTLRFSKEGIKLGFTMGFGGSLGLLWDDN
jgi:hypothetical protein